MSGSSGGGGGGFSENHVDCADLRFSAQLSSPQPAVVGSLKVGDVLQVNIAQLGSAQALAVLSSGVPAGTLLGANATRLRECILKGHSYCAKVTSLNGAQVLLDIEHV